MTSKRILFYRHIRLFETNFYALFEKEKRESVEDIAD